VATGIAHEINNPLGILVNRIECIEAEAEELGVPEVLARDLAAVRAQADRISRITQSILALSRGSACSHKPVDMRSVVESALAVAGERLSAREGRIEAELASLSLPVRGDRARLESVIVNVLNNAIDAIQSMGADGRITIDARPRRDVDGDWVVIRVADNGPGIPEAVLPRIFEPFFTTKPPGQGSGLGLFLSYSIVAEHRGRLEASNGEMGTVFTITLPALIDLAGMEQESMWESKVRS